MGLRRWIAVAALVAGVLVLPVADRRVAADHVGDAFTLVGPFRFGDTRLATRIGPNGTLSPNAAVDIQIRGVGGIPQDASIVTGTLTAVPAGQAGHLTVYPSGGSPPNVSNLNFGPAAPVANTVFISIGANGRVSVVAPVRTDFILDVNGYFSRNGQGELSGRTGTRSLDRRVGPNTPFVLVVPTTIDVPLASRDLNANATPYAGFLNLTIDQAEGNGHATIRRPGQNVDTSNLNFVTGQTVAGAAIAPFSLVTLPGLGQRYAFEGVLLGAGGRVVVDGITEFIQTGTTTGQRVSPVTPKRCVDTRTNSIIGPQDGMLGGRSITFNLRELCGVGSDSGALFVNVTLINRSRPNHISSAPPGLPIGETSILNGGPGFVGANATLVQLSVDGGHTFHVVNDADILIDVFARVIF